MQLDIEDFPDIRKGFKIVLRFTKNKFFENTELTKTMEFNLNAGTAETKCTPINWHDGQVIKIGILCLVQFQISSGLPYLFHNVTEVALYCVQESKVGDASNLFMWFITSESLDGDQSSTSAS